MEELRAEAARIVASMDLETKVRMLSGRGFWTTEPVPEAGLEGIVVADGPHGLRCQVGSSDHLGLAAARPATCFPPAVLLGSSWDPDLVAEVGAAIGDEALAQGVSVVLGPGLNIKRHPAGGRNFEYYSEDPLLGGRLAAAMVRGIQSRGVGACAKHFAVNNQESYRLVVDALVDERTIDSSRWLLFCVRMAITLAVAALSFPESRRRIDRVRASLGFDLPPLETATWASHRAAAAETARAAITVAHGGESLPLRLAAGDRLCLVSVKTGNLTPAETVGEGASALADQVRSRHAATTHVELEYGADEAAVEAVAAACGQADVVVVATPWDAAASTVAAVADELGEKVVISMANAIAKVGHEFQPLVPPRGSVAASVQAAVPRAHVSAAFHHVPARALAGLDAPVESDVLVCSDHPDATETTIEIVGSIPGLRALDSGELSNAAPIEAFAAVLLQVNVRYRTRVALRFTGLDDVVGAPRSAAAVRAAAARQDVPSARGQ